MFASLVASSAMTLTVDFSIVVGKKSTGDDLAVSERINLAFLLSFVCYHLMMNTVLSVCATNFKSPAILFYLGNRALELFIKQLRFRKLDIVRIANSKSKTCSSYKFFIRSPQY